MYQEEHFGFVEEIKEVESEQYDDEGNEWIETELIAVVKWFDGHRESVWTDTDVWNETKVLR